MSGEKGSAGLPERLEAHSEYLHGQDGLLLAGCHGEATNVSEGCALAAEIARRWNAHEKLVAALERVLDSCFCDDGRDLPECAQCVALRAALRAAKETR